jgi:hypothetical protein
MYRGVKASAARVPSILAQARPQKPCHLCKKLVGYKLFCWGCNTTICDDHPDPSKPGPHKPEDHK